MKQAVKYIALLLLPLGTLLVALYFAIRKIQDNVVINSTIKDVDFTKLLTGTLTSDLHLTITNKNPFSITVRLFEIEIYKKDTLFARSVEPMDMELEKGFSKEFNIPMNVLLSNVIIGYSKGEDGAGTDFSYKAKYKVFGFKQEVSDKIKL